MVARRRGFALMLVLVVTAAVFALAMQGAASLRAATIESAATRDMRRLERDARSASMLMLLGLTVSASDLPPGLGGGGGGGANADDGGSKPPPRDPRAEPEIPDLPPEIKSLLGDLLNDLFKEPTKPDAGGDGDGGQPARSSSSRRRDEPPGPLRWLATRGIPSDPIEVRVNGRTARVRMVDEAGLVSVNAAPEEQLAAYFALRGIPDGDALAIAQQIIDWRDEDDFVRPRGAEKSQHLARGVSPRNGPILTLEELLYLPDMTRDRFELVRDGLTVLGDGRIHAGSAPVEVLASVPGVDTTAAAKIVALRQIGRLDRETLRQALGPFGARLEAAFRLEPQGRMRMRVSFDSPPVEFEGEADVSNRDGVRIVSMRPVSRPLEAPGR